VPQRITEQLLVVLQALTEDPMREWYGLELMDTTGLSSGTLYPILHRLVGDGWLVRTRDAPSDIGGSGRRMYTLTGAGARVATDLLAARSARRRRSHPSFGRGVQPA
jgi:PadR family transcriptional regulator PadR